MNTVFETLIAPYSNHIPVDPNFPVISLSIISVAVMLITGFILAARKTNPYIFFLSMLGGMFAVPWAIYKFLGDIYVYITAFAVVIIFFIAPIVSTKRDPAPVDHTIKTPPK